MPDQDDGKGFHKGTVGSYSVILMRDLASDASGTVCSPESGDPSTHYSSHKNQNRN